MKLTVINWNLVFFMIFILLLTAAIIYLLYKFIKFRIKLRNDKTLTRDKLKDKSYFVTFLAEEKNTIQELTNSIQSPTVNHARIPYMWDAILICHLDIVIAEYSIGSDKFKITESLINTIEVFENHYVYKADYGDYDIMIWILSIAILCDLEIDYFKKITEVIKKSNVQDKLIDFMIQSKQPDWISEGTKILQTHPYAKTEMIQNEKDIEKYLNVHWYKGHSDAAWYDTHKIENVNVFPGYWAWEVGAIAKIKKINDMNIKDLNYYPYDAVHW